jgi:integrase
LENETVLNNSSIESANKPMRKGNVILVDRMCEKHVAERVKIFDRRCPGLYVSIVPAGIATFSFKYTDKAINKQRSIWLGIHCPGFKVEDAREQADDLRNRLRRGENVTETLRQQKAKASKQGITVDELIEKRIDWMEVPEKKDDGEMCPRIESWKNVARHLRNLISPRLGRMIARDVTNDDIATLSNDIIAGRYIVDGKARKASPSNARHVRRAASAMFKWAMEAGNKFVDVSPCLNLPKLKKERARSRVLSETEIRMLWHGLDRNDLPCDRRTALAIKFTLASMLRSWEALGIARSELDVVTGVVNIPAKRVKKRRLICQPLSDLALEILTQSLGNHDFAFMGRFGDAPLCRHAMSDALRGTKHRNGEVKTPGICALLGLKPFTPHDLRRTAATMSEYLRLPGGDIALCLDHQSDKDENGNDWPVVTQEVYGLGFTARVTRKRKVLDAWAVELRRIIGEPAAVELPIAA